MRLLHRKARPLTRDATSLRDDRLFFVACDDTYAPKQYFGFFRITRVQIHVVPTVDGTSTAEAVMQRLLQFKPEEDDELWMLLDTDHCIKKEHLKSFTNAISDAQRRGINVALSKPCFELWLLMHQENMEIASLKNASETEAALSAKLGGYNKNNLKKEHYPIASVKRAIKQAQEMDKKIGGRIPSANTSRVYLLWQAIIAKALPTQLPPELRGF